MEAAVSTTRTSTTGARDLRLDFFRGLALIFIFLDHIPANRLSWLTVRNFGFSDATEIFVFISGYTAVVAYGGAMHRFGFRRTAARVLHRVWRLYTAHIFLFVVFTAQIAYVAQSTGNSMFSEEMKIVGFLNEPHVNLVQALMLKFRPVNMDVLPLYIVLLIAFPVLLWVMQRRVAATLLASSSLWLVANKAGWNFPAYPEGGWAFNPLCWQLLFVLGAGMALVRSAPPLRAGVIRFLWIAAPAYLAFSFIVVLGWNVPQLAALVPDALARSMYPINKGNLDVLRLVHFLALAFVVSRLVRPSAGFLHWRITRPVIRAGSHSLQVFCLGIFLAFTGHFILVEFNDAFAIQALVSVAGIALMILTAEVADWYKRGSVVPVGRSTGVETPGPGGRL